MADSNRVVYPDEFEEIKAKKVQESQASVNSCNKTNEGHEDNIIYPEQFEEMKMKKVKTLQARNPNSIGDTPTDFKRTSFPDK